MGSCTFCKTKHARGNLQSYPIINILDRIIQCIGEGIVEIWLTSEDTAAYGIDIQLNIIDLMNSIINVIENEYPYVMIRIGMTNPP